jgi:hypothetical protein
MNIGQDIERMVNKEVEKRLSEYARVVALLVERMGGEARIPQDDMSLPASAIVMSSFTEQGKDEDGVQVVIRAEVRR